MEQHSAFTSTSRRGNGYCYFRLASVRNHFVLATLALAFLFNGVAFSLGPYYVTDFGAFSDGGETMWARDVNSQGQVVGRSTTDVGFRAFLWEPNELNGKTGELFRLEGLSEGGNSDAYAVNDRGQVVGRADAESGQRGFLWQPDTLNSTSGSIYDLGDLAGGGDFSSASGINSIGQIVGYSKASTGNRSFLWQPTSNNSTEGDLIDLGDLPGGEDYSVAHDINDRGQVVGTSWSTNERHPYVWNPSLPNASSGVLHDLGDLSGGRDEGGAIGINDSGQIVGHSSAASGFRGFLTYIEASTPTITNLFDLGDLLGGSDYSLARDINNHGQIVGVGSDSGWRAVTWKDPSNIVDLNRLLEPISGAGWILNYASGINDAGQIVGYGTLNGDTRGFLLTPIAVPSPSTMTMAAIQAMLILTCWRHKCRT